MATAMQMPTDSRLLWSAAVGVAAAAGAYVSYRAAVSAGPQAHPALKTLKGLPPFPFFLKPLFMLPESILKHILPPVPEHIPDRVDAFGESSHKMTMNASAGVLTIEYDFAMDADMFNFFSAAISDDKRKEIIDSAEGDQKEQLLQDFEAMACCKRTVTKEDVGKGAYMKAGFYMKARMAAIKMSNGGVLLFNPVKLTPEVKARIEQLGEVRWIVTGSCAHTLFAKSAVKAFPTAKFVGPRGANIKLAKVGIKPVYDYTKPSDLAHLQEELGLDLDLLYIPDPLAHNLIVKKRDAGMIFEVDLMYNSDTQESKDSIPGRLMKVTAIRDSPNKLLPVYRFPPLLGGFFPVLPKAEPDCREKTTEAIKKLLQQWSYETVWSAHSPEVPADMFRSMITKMWLEWLEDPDTLLA